MFIKIALSGTAVVATAAFLIPPFGRRLNQNVLEPVRQYNAKLNNEWEF